MPAVGGMDRGTGKAYPGNLTPFVTVTCIVAAMGGLIFGYDIGISGNTLCFLFWFFSLFIYLFLALFFDMGFFEQVVLHQ